MPLRIKPVTIGDLIRDGKLLEVHCGNCRPARHLYIDAGSLDLPKRLPVAQIADHLVCSVCGAKNSGTYHPMDPRRAPDAAWHRELAGRLVPANLDAIGHGAGRPAGAGRALTTQEG